jgi:hypothetical protein
MTEKWKQVEGFERYLVSNTGRVITTVKGSAKELKPQQDAVGYLHYRLYPEDERFGSYGPGRGKRPRLFKAHKLVLETFSPTLDTELQHSWDLGKRIHTHKKIARCNRKPIVAVHRDGTCRYFKGNIVAKIGMGCSNGAIANSLKSGKYLERGPAKGYKFIRPAEAIEEYQFEDVPDLEKNIDAFNLRIYGKYRKQLHNTIKYKKK